VDLARPKPRRESPANRDGSLQLPKAFDRIIPLVVARLDRSRSEIVLVFARTLIAVLAYSLAGR
jgi:hypothetical protein